MTPKSLSMLLAVSIGAASLVGCQEERSEDPPIAPERNMYDQERYNPESYSQFFPDHRTMRTPVEGTVARDGYERGGYEDDQEIVTGLLPDNSGYVMAVPPAFVNRQGGMEKLLARGQERFGIYCAPCHGLTGDGKGMVVCKRDKATDPCQSRGFAPLPSYEDVRLREMPDGQVFATITHGVRTMPAYGPQIPVADRWAIVAYVRALQLSQLAQAQPTTEPKSAPSPEGDRPQGGRK